MYFSGGCAWILVMCTFVAGCHYSCWTIQYSDLWWLHIRKTKLVTYVSICTDGAAAMTEWLSGFTTWVKEVTYECESAHCVIHREMLANWKMSPELSVLQDLIKMINHIKVHALNSMSVHAALWGDEYRAHITYTEKWDGFLKGDH